jgi:hypothetical protein
VDRLRPQSREMCSGCLRRVARGQGARFSARHHHPLGTLLSHPPWPHTLARTPPRPPPPQTHTPPPALPPAPACACPGPSPQQGSAPLPAPPPAAAPAAAAGAAAPERCERSVGAGVGGGGSVGGGSRGCRFGHRVWEQAGAAWSERRHRGRRPGRQAASSAAGGEPGRRAAWQLPRTCLRYLRYPVNSICRLSSENTSLACMCAECVCVGGWGCASARGESEGRHTAVRPWPSLRVRGRQRAGPAAAAAEARRLRQARSLTARASQRSASSPSGQERS